MRKTAARQTAWRCVQRMQLPALRCGTIGAPPPPPRSPPPPAANYGMRLLTSQDPKRLFELLTQFHAIFYGLAQVRQRAAACA